MVRKVLLTGTEKDLWTFEHDLFWFLHRHIIPILIFWSFIIGSQFAMEVSMGVFFNYGNGFLATLDRKLKRSWCPVKPSAYFLYLPQRLSEACNKQRWKIFKFYLNKNSCPKKRPHQGKVYRKVLAVQRVPPSPEYQPQNLSVVPSC